ncbi:hypothetical protein [Actinomycetospora chiangmaiensis]|uniref:hypothetical protein n=1 Tax=Actinomycetospora chiangmaiensis TaxID=402650 RepID=UPI000371C5B6|nr:hypothetical protein [Actinomycetospora chiangmaiensis]
MLIDCDTCVVRHQACDDCVVGVLLGVPEVPVRDEGPREPAAPGAPLPLDFGPVERRALEVLADHGLIPRLRLVPGAADQPPARPAGRPRRRDAG